MPQLPQLAGSVEVSAQALPHAWSGAVQFVVHTPRSQTCPLEHAWPQPPQFCASLFGLTQLPPHWMSPVAQTGGPPSVPETPAVPPLPPPSNPPVPPVPPAALASVPAAPAAASAPPLPPVEVVLLLELLHAPCARAASPTARTAHKRLTIPGSGVTRDPL